MMSEEELMKVCDLQRSEVCSLTVVELALSAMACVSCFSWPACLLAGLASDVGPVVFEVATRARRSSAGRS